MTDTTGPDIAGIFCYTPDGCCAPSPCRISEDEFICQIRQLLPEGEIYNTTLQAYPTDNARPQQSGVTIGCSNVGCEQLIFGGCCDDTIQCTDQPWAPQLAVLDSFSATAYGAVKALCDMLKELDPCTADLTVRRWAERMGLLKPDYCTDQWPDHVLAVLICYLPQISRMVMNWESLQAIAARFGADLVLHAAGDFNCGPDGWWTMAREQQSCPQFYRCPTDEELPPDTIARMTPTCLGTPDSLNLVISPADIQLPPNCNNPPVPDTLPHDPDLYEAFKWLLPKILPQPVFWCVYERDPENCIV
jgi:hypothetical protein